MARDVKIINSPKDVLIGFEITVIYKIRREIGRFVLIFLFRFLDIV